MKKDQKSKIRFFIIVVIVEIILVISIISYLGILLTKKSGELSAKTQELQDLVQSVHTIETLKNENEKENENLTNLKSKFFNDDSLLTFLKNFCNKANIYNLEIFTMEFGTLSPVVDTSPPLKKLPVSISMRGSYRSLTNFLKYLESNKEHIEEIDLNFSNDTVLLNMVFYVQTNSLDRWVYEGAINE
ncbi:MAG: hypothetical protein K6343_00705 [Caldisericaceae bacterium]